MLDPKLGSGIFQLEEFHAVSKIAQQYHLFPGIQKPKKHLFIQDIVEYKIVSDLKLLVVTITGL